MEQRRGCLSSLLLVVGLSGALWAAGHQVSSWAYAAGASAPSAAKPPLAKPRAVAVLNQTIKPLPRYVSLDTINLLRELRNGPGQDGPAPLLQPLLSGAALPFAMHDLLKNPAADLAVNASRVMLAQAPAPAPAPVVPPAPVAGAAPAGAAAGAATSEQMPHWVRYPLEFQLCGIGLGTRAVDKDRFNRIDRYGLFAMHGNPTAVVVPVIVENAGGGGEGGGTGTGGGSGSGSGGGGGGEGAAAAPATPQTAELTVQQQPPQASALFPASENGEMPSWAAAITVRLDNNHVEWLYNRGTYAMGFTVDRLGFVDAIVVAGTYSPIARTQLEDPVHTVKLGDDTRKVLYRYGYPDSIETYPVNVVTAGGGGGAPAGGAPAGGGAAGGGSGGAEGGGGGGAATLPPGAEGEATTGASGSVPFRMFEFRYEQSYNVVFTIRNNRVVRMYIFGDPDFFNAQNRELLRTSY